MAIPPQLIEQLKTAKRVLVLTRAGVSAEIGIPPFSEVQTGLWAKFDPKQLATPRAFRRNPRLVWEWYEYRRRLVAEAKPNRAHTALAQLEKLFPEFHLLTQNIDGLHQRAGSRNVTELHGNISRTKCFDEGTIISNWAKTGDVPPKCPNCGGLLRPDVVWFEEPMPENETALAFQLSARCDLFLSIGTSAIVYPAASLPFDALENGATVVEINPQSTPLTGKATFVLAGAAGMVVPDLLESIQQTDTQGQARGER